MTFIGRTLSLLGLRGPRKREGTQLSEPWGYADRSAAPVTFDTAMSISAFWASARLIAEVIAAMPIVCYRVEGGTRRKDTAYALWRLLNYQPNRYQTRVEFFETLSLNLATTGNSYHAVERDGAGQPVSLLPLMSGQTEPVLERDGSVTYRHLDAAGNVRVFAAESVLHIKLFGNGLVGLSPLGHARQALGIAIAQENRSGKLASSGGKTSGVLMLDAMLKPEQREQVRKEFARLTQGEDDHLFVLEAGAKYQQTSLSPMDIQLLESRRFQVEDIARFMGVPSVLINDTSGSTTWGSGIEQLVQGFYKLNLRPYLERIEASIKRHLMPIADWERIEIEFDFDSLLRADLAARMQAYKEGVNAGLYTANEVREAEGLPPRPGGDQLLVNGTMVPISQAQAPSLPRRET